MSWTSNSAALGNTVPTIEPTLQPVTFPALKFDATLYVPKGADEGVAVPTEDEDKLTALEDSATAPPPEVRLAERTLIEIAGNRLLSEASRVRACQIILERSDLRIEIAALKNAIAELKTKRLEEFESV